MNEQIVFQVKTLPVFFTKNTCGDCLSVYEDGRIAKNEYIFEKSYVPLKESLIEIIPEVVDDLQRYYIEKKHMINSLPPKLMNARVDGSWDCFQFNDKIISANGIQRLDVEEIQKTNKKYYRYFKKDIVSANIVLNMYEDVMNIISVYVKDIDFPLKNRLKYCTFI